ncbi:hypothetical Protein psc5_07140 [Candidatus Phytoplasma solani]
MITNLKLSRTLNIIQYCSKNNLKLKDTLQWGMNNIENTLEAFNAIANNKGAGTSGVDGQTINGMTLKTIDKIHHEYVNGKYHATPVRRVVIPKSNGKTRPLGIPTIKDRIIQKSLEQLLTPYFEEIFSPLSFGFRTNKSCHDAIKAVKAKFQGIDYIIKIDIEGYFDTIDHNILHKMLTQYITKNKVLTTINNWLKAGIMKNCIKFNTLSGSPQGGIISPLLSNIYAHYIDTKIEELVKIGTPKKKWNPEYERLRRLGQHKNSNVNSQININPNTRVEYTRYADDFIIGVGGNYNKAQHIMEQVIKWLTQDLNLKISKDKSKIVKANKGTKFLSYMVKVNPTNSTKGNKTTKNSFNGCTKIQVPRQIIKEYGQEYSWTKRGKIKHDESLASRDKLEIIKTYKTILNGILHYFCYGNNIATLGHLAYIAEYSCLKTLARKDKTSIARVRKKHKIKSQWGIEYKDNKGKNHWELWPKFTWENIKKMRKWNTENVDQKPNPMIYQGRTNLTDRLAAEQCTICGQTSELELHQTKTLRNTKGRAMKDKKTIVLCRTCHRKRTNQQMQDIRKHNKTKNR